MNTEFLFFLERLLAMLSRDIFKCLQFSNSQISSRIRTTAEYEPFSADFLSALSLLHKLRLGRFCPLYEWLIYEWIQILGRSWVQSLFPTALQIAVIIHWSWPAVSYGSTGLLEDTERTVRSSFFSNSEKYRCYTSLQGFGGLGEWT